RQGGLELLQLGLDPLDDVEGVLPLSHDDDASHDVAGAVQVRDPTAQIGTKRHVADVAHAYGNAVLVPREDDLADVGGRLRVAAAADHVFRTRHLDEPPADVVV